MDELAIMQALVGLDSAARQRVLAWATSRWPSSTSGRLPWGEQQEAIVGAMREANRPVTAPELSALGLASPQTVYASLRRLETRGLVARAGGVPRSGRSTVLWSLSADAPVAE